MESAHGGDAVAAYWRSVNAAANGPEGPKRDRAIELLRLEQLANDIRSELIPELPPLTINTADISGRVSAKVDKLGGWGQGVSIQLKTSRVDPFNTRAADAGLAPTTGDKSLVFGHPLKHTREGERLRRFEADLLLLQQCLRALQHLTVERQHQGWGQAESDIRSWGGSGDWFAGRANTIWRQWCAAEGMPFVPVRHNRWERELKSPGIRELNAEDQEFSWMRPSCSGWPTAALASTRDMPRERPEVIKAGDEQLVILEDQWNRWQQEEQALKAALWKRLGSDLIQQAVAWPEGLQPVIDEVDGEPVVQMPVASKPIPTSTKVTINYDAGDALQAVEAVLAGVDRERGTNLWPTFLQLACNHPAAPGASRVQTELEIDLDAPAPIEAGEPWEINRLEDRIDELEQALFQSWGERIKDQELMEEMGEWIRKWIRNQTLRAIAGAPEPAPIEAGEPTEVVITVDKAEPMATPASPFHLEQEVSHEAFGRGVVIKLIGGTVAVDFNGTKQIVMAESLAPIEAGELPVDEAVVQATEATPIEAGERPDPIDPGDPAEHRLSIGCAWPFAGTKGLQGRFVVGLKQGKTITQLVCRPNPVTGSVFTSRPAPWPVIYDEEAANAVADRLGCKVFRADTAVGLLHKGRGPWQWADDAAPIEAGEPSQSPLRKQRKARTALSDEANQAITDSIRTHLALAEPPRGWKSELAREHGVTASVITARIKAMEAA